MPLPGWWYRIAGRGLLLALPLLPLLQGGCVRLQRLEKQTLYSQALQRRVPFAVYLPPGHEPGKYYPLVVFLHGGGDDYKAFERFGGVRFLDEAIGSGAVPPFIMVAPNGEMGFWMNYHDGTLRYEDHVIEEVIPWVEAHYPVIADREHRTIFGISMGAFGAMNLATRHADLFSAVAALSGPMYDREEALAFTDSTWKKLLGIERVFGGEDDLEFLVQNGPYEKIRLGRVDLGDMRILLLVGDQDRPGLLNNNRRLHDLLQQRGIESELLVFEGRHKWVSWNPYLGRVLAFLLGRGESE